MKSYTDLEQSKKLAEILPLESADMCYIPVADDEKGDYLYNTFIKSEIILREDDERIECWSLAVLIKQIPERLRDKDGLYYDLEITKNSDLYSVFYYNENEGRFYYISCMDTLVDACYEMILKLHELKML